MVFALTAVGFLLMLFLQESRADRALGPPARRGPGRRRPERLRRQHRRRAHHAPARSAASPPRWRSSCRCSIPTFSLQLFDFGLGPGGDDDISIENPMTDLQARPRPAARTSRCSRCTTDDPDPAYLRIAVLNRFTDNEWSSGDRDVPGDQTADGAMPGLQGVSAERARDEYDYDVQATRDVPVDVAAHPGPDRRDRGARRLALRRLDDGLHRRRRRPRHRAA